MSRHSLTRTLAVTTAGAAALLGLVGVPAQAVNADHGSAIVSADPADFTPQVMNGSVNAITQVGNKIIAAGTFTTVRQTLNGPNITRNRIFAFDASTGQIDPNFNPNLGGAANSLDTDGSSVYVGGSFGSVGGNTAIRRVVKLSATGAVDPAFKAVPNASVKEVVVRGSRLYVGGAFTNIKSGTVTTSRSRLAALDPGTGAVLAGVDVPFTGIYDPSTNNGGGSTSIERFDVSPDGSRLVAIGNFSTVGGQPRSQIAMLDTSGPTATLAPWATDRFDSDHNDCAAVFNTFTRNIDFSPDGSYFVVSATGAFAGGADAGTMCDTTSRWETDSTGNEPTWTDYTGGDTTYGVAVTGAAVYVGGHIRWQNNPYQGDQAGPGAVPRTGIAALDPTNGLPLSWNPGRSRGVGAQALFATPQGLWVGSDTTKIGNETHSRIALMPLAGGTTVRSVAPASLPNDLFLAQRMSCSSTGVLYRVNAGGPPITEDNGSLSWESDDSYVNTGNAADWGGAPAVDNTVPACTSPDIFGTERWDDGSAPEMHFGFPVPAGQQVNVRLYFADRCSCTSNPGDRVFDVSIDGQLKLDNFDINAAVGHDRGTMRQFPVTSDGTVDIDFAHVTENPLVNGIEIVTGSGPVPSSGVLLRRAVDANGSPTGPATTANSAMDWSKVRGAFYLDGTVYYGLNDGSLYSRTFDKSTGATGPQQTVNLYDDPDTGERIPFAIASLTGMFYDPATHRLYYTVRNDPQLYYRYFTPESKVVGAQTFDASSSMDFSDAAGMTLANGKVLFGSRVDGALRSVPFGGGQVSGTPSVVSNDGSWRYGAIFVPND